MVRRDVDLLSPLGAAVSKSVWFCFFGRRAVSAFLGSCDDCQKFTAAPVCPLPHESCIIAAAKSGLLGALLCGGIEGKVVGHPSSVTLCRDRTISQPLRYGPTLSSGFACPDDSR